MATSKATVRGRQNGRVKFGRVSLDRLKDPAAPDFVPEPRQFVDPLGYCEKFAYAIDAGQDILLMGDTGVGKNALIEYMAGKVNQSLYTLPCEEATDMAAIVGKPWLVEGESGGTEMVFQRGPAYNALLDDAWLNLDEWNGAHPDVQMGLHPLFAVDRGFLVVKENEGEVVERGERFTMIATGNPFSDYVGVKEWNSAQLSRFETVIWMKYLPAKDEAKLLLDDVDGLAEAVAASMVKAAGTVRDAREEQKLRFPFSYRELRAWGLASLTFGVKEAADLAVTSKCDRDDQEGVTTLLEQSFDPKVWSA